MSETLIYSLIMLGSVLIASISQIGLKISSNKKYDHVLKEYLNPWVIGSYILFFVSTLLTVLAMRVLTVSHAMILESAGYIFVAIFSFTLLKERISLKKFVGIFFILLGILVYSMDYILV